MAYMSRYRQGMAQDYSTNLREALAMAGQRSTLAGRTMSPEQMAAIAQGVLTPYLGAYGTGMEQAYQADLEQAQAEKEYEMEQEALKQEEKAAETAAVGQAGSAAIAGGMLYEKYYAGGQAGAGGGGGGAGAGTTTTSGAGWGSAFAFVGGGAVGYTVAPYGQQAEEGIGGPTRMLFKPDPIGTNSRRRGQRLGMMATGGLAGGVATGGSPYGAAGGVVGGYFAENPETGKRGYQETWEYEIKPAYQKVVEPYSIRPFFKPEAAARKSIMKTEKKLRKKFTPF